MPDLPGWNADGASSEEATAHGEGARQAGSGAARGTGGPCPNPGSQHGFALMLMLLVLVMGGVTVFLAARETAPYRRAQRIIEESNALDAARGALIAYALAGHTGTSTPTPGALPCPDMNRDGETDNTQCQADGADPAFWLGRLPHATLDMAAGEIARSGRLWYALDDDFLDFNNTIVNPASEASLRIAGSPHHYAALVILAHDPVDTSQDRPSETIGDYLEGENVDGDTTFASCDTANCNDRVIGITQRELLDPVRARLLGAVRIALTNIHDDVGFYPWAAKLGDPDGACDAGRNRGALPVAHGDCGAFVAPVSAGGYLPDWIVENRWHRYLFYAVAEPCAPGGNCVASASGLLTLDGADNKAVIFGLTGVPIVSNAKGGPQVRGGSAPRDVIEYLDSHENTDGDNAFDDPANGSGENDHLRAIAAPP